MKLGIRLQQLLYMIHPETSQYDHIWDCCCDHGLLGMALLDTAEIANTKIHFVDVIPHIMTVLEGKLNANYENKTWQTHCLDVQQLPLNKYKHSKHLVIIAGIGGDLTAKLVNTLKMQYPQQDIDFLLCPVHRIYSLRQQLINLELRIKAECLIEENKRFYEALWLTTQHQCSEPIHPIGSFLWQANTPKQTDTARRYKQQCLAHFKRMQTGGSEDVSDIIAAYEQIKHV